MHSSKRLVFGILSSLLLAVGFVRAADRLDPMSQSLRPSMSEIVLDDGPPPPCVSPCNGGNGSGD